jgi:6-phosphogluconolactonase
VACSAGEINVVQSDSFNLSNSTFAVLDDQLLFVILELESGNLAVVDTLTGRTVNKFPTHGAGPCHAVMSIDRRFVGVSHYGSGSFSLLRANGVGPEMQAITWSSSAPASRSVLPDQEVPRLHSALQLGQDHWLVANLGSDRLELLEYDISAGLFKVGEVVLPTGSGPRHMVKVGNEILITGELDGQIHVVNQTSVLGYQGSFYSSEHTPEGIVVPSHLEYDDAYGLLVANRGSNTISRFVRSGNEWKRTQEISTGGVWPRHFMVTPNNIIVANQISGTITCISRDPLSGLLIGDAYEVAQVEGASYVGVMPVSVATHGC